MRLGNYLRHNFNGWGSFSPIADRSNVYVLFVIIHYRGDDGTLVPKPPHLACDRLYLLIPFEVVTLLFRANVDVFKSEAVPRHVPTQNKLLRNLFLNGSMCGSLDQKDD